MRPGDKNSLSFNRLSFIIDWFLGLPSLSLARPFRVPPWRLDASAWASPSNYGLQATGYGLRATGYRLRVGMLFCIAVYFFTANE